MSPKISLTTEEKQLIEALVKHYKSNEELFEGFRHQLEGILVKNSELKKYIHSIKWRLKEPSHLRDKLIRMLDRAKRNHTRFNITNENLFVKINDLVGFRILHLYTKQFKDINNIIKKIFVESRIKIIGAPTAKTWDDESRDYFKSLKIKTEKSKTLYTSVHYVIQNNQKTKATAEIQVRTLAEELWGEVDHTFNYPHPSKNKTCREQIKVLARVTSSCTRLVDSIFETQKK